MKITREFYIPKNAEVREYPELSAVVYYYMNGDKPAAMCFSGRRQKPDRSYYYRSEERRDQDVQKWLDGLKKHQEYKAQRKAEKTGLAEPAYSAKVLKGYLQQLFPSTKFSVKSDTFSMGCSIDVSYTDGPLAEEVDAIAGLFEYGRFDAMQDLSYSVPVHVPGCRGAKYVHVNRRRSPELEATLKSILEEQFIPYHGDNFSPYQWSEAERLYLGVTAEEIKQKNQERVALVLGKNAASENAPEDVKNTPEVETTRRGC